MIKWAKNTSHSPKELPKFPALRQNTSNNIYTKDFKDKVQILRERFFPPSQEVNLEGIFQAEYPAPLLSAMRVTPEEVEAAIQWPKSDKVPGIDGVPGRFLRQVLEVFLSHFTYLFQACVELGYHFKEFRVANTIVLRKPWKDDYSLAESYRPIALLSTLGKALKSVIAHCLSNLTEVHKLFPP